MTLRRLIDKCLMHFMAWINYPVAKTLTRGTDLRKDKFFCISMSGNSYGDNIKYLSNYISAHSTNAEIVWAFSSEMYSKVDCPFKKVKLYTFRYYYHVLTSKYILSNARLNQRMLHKRKGQIYLQTWHGTALKRLGKDVKKEKKSWLLRLIKPDVFQFDVNNTDIMISGSRFMSDIYRHKFLFKGQIKETGTPRNDLFFHDHPEINGKVRSYYKIDTESQIILYAPTFRSDGKFTYYNIDAKALMATWEKKTNKRCVFMVRLHPNLQYKSNDFISTFPNGTINASEYPDMQELLYSADLLITDYSSSMFDFMYSYKPVLLYIPDKESYDRGFYFNIENLPFMVSYSNNEITNNLALFDSQNYSIQIQTFLRVIGDVESGKATEKIYHMLKSLA